MVDRSDYGRFVSVFNLINNDVDSSSSKNVKAKELSIPIISEEDFVNIIGGDNK
jgi:hypothetical protein